MNRFFDFVGFTVLLGFGGGLALVRGHRRLAGLLWTLLGAGSVGAAFDAATSGKLRFNKIGDLDTQAEFLMAHLPFLILGVILWTEPKERKCLRRS